ncbi:unnamed protein product [Calicophoron daubneyi]|uniref:Rab-like protein 3 n=1 Tax=Calicophoron daubneyi TaxID=300641 RepID=A0AAV2T4C3_CALDB
MIEYEKAKVVVVGDSGVGKTALVHLFCKQQPLLNPSYTIGCSLDVKVHMFRADPSQERPFFIEFWDIGGSNAHANTRPIFYQNAHGIILVYDCTNRKSQLNLKKWLSEVTQKTPSSSLEGINVCESAGLSKVAGFFTSSHEEDFDTNSRDSGKSNDDGLKFPTEPTVRLPILVVGTKVDLLDSSSRRKINRWFTGRSSASSTSLPLYSSTADEVRSSATRIPPFSAYSPDGEKTYSSGSVHINLNTTPPHLSKLAGSSKDPSSSFSAEQGFPELLLSCNSLTYLAPNSWNAVLLDKFLDDVVQYRLGGISSYGHSPESKSRRFPADSLSNTNSSLRIGCLNDDTDTSLWSHWNPWQVNVQF